MKNLLLTLILISSFQFVFTQAFSQVPVIKWQNTIGGSLDDKLQTMVKTVDGGYICGGYSLSGISGDKTKINKGGEDYWVVKIDSLGNILWQNTLGGNLDDNLKSIFPTSDGGCICGGDSKSGISGNKTENNMGFHEDYWVIKLDSIGKIQWQNTIGGNTWDNLNSISQTNDGGYICGGTSWSNISGDKTENNNGFADYWIVKLDSTGLIQWQNTIGGDDDDFLMCISQTVDNGYICGGYSYSNVFGDKTEGRNGMLDYWIIKLDSIGNIQWQNDIGGSYNDVLYSISQTNDGGYIVGGNSLSPSGGDKIENTTGGQDFWILKLDSIGNIVWQNTIGGTNNDELYSILQVADGGYICAGTSLSGISGDKTESNHGSDDCWILKLDALGNIQWQNSIGGSTLDWATVISQTVDGDYIFGATSLSDISGDKSENCIGGFDFWTIKFTYDFNSITGKVFADLNNNSVQDIGEPAISHNRILELNSGNKGFSDNNGLYVISGLDTGNFVVTPAPLANYNPSPNASSVYFSGIKQLDSLNNFAFQPTGSYNDLKIKLTPLGDFNPGFNGFYQLDYQNVGTTTLNGNVIFYLDVNLTYVSSTLTPVSITADSAVWNTGSLGPFQGGSIIVTVVVNSTTPIGTVLHPISKILPLTGDVVPQDNSSSWEVTVTGSVDPNDIVVSRKRILTTELPGSPWLEYIIRFQNTGNDTAINIKILNPIDTSMLQLNTIEMIASSHPYQVQFNDWERNMQFTFNTILLPDSAVNEAASHGFIRYRIKPKTTLNINDKIKNQAYIYFDFNFPVPTDTAITKIVLPAGITPLPQNKEIGLSIFPNPSSERITIQLTDPKETIREIKIHDLLGRIIFEKQFQNKYFKPETEIDISGFNQGICLIEVLTNNRSYRSRFSKK